MYTAHADEIPELASELGVIGSSHLFLRFGRHAFTDDGARVNAFGLGPKGLSAERRSIWVNLRHQNHMRGTQSGARSSAEW